MKMIQRYDCRVIMGNLLKITNISYCLDFYSSDCPNSAKKWNFSPGWGHVVIDF